MTQNMHPHWKASRSLAGFTLVEILVVIVIIGILAGLAIPAATAVIGRAKNTAIKVELDTMGQALEGYRQQYGDYPPDFSDWKKVERHFRRAFPEIDDSELRILAQFTHLDAQFRRVAAGSLTDPRSGSGYAHYRQCIDPAEALVFCLGGFSSDVQHPFTGTGGPLSPITTGGTVARSYSNYQYNVDRTNNLFEFEPDGLSLVVANDPDADTPVDPLGAGGFYTYSDDEFQTAVTGNGGINGDYSSRALGSPFSAVRYLLDPFPTYSSGDSPSPLVYFNADSYQYTFTPATITGGWVGPATLFHNLNYMASPTGDAEQGVARPYLSADIDTNAGGFLWVDQNKFQLISPGQDGSYGGTIANGVVDPTDASTANAAGVVTIYPSGKFANAAGQLASNRDKYEDPESIYSREKPQLDNITSFSNLLLGDDLP